MEIGIVGVGHVGLVTGACLAELGHRVIGVDEDEAKISTLQAGSMPFYEPHLEPFVRQQRAAGRLHFSTDVAKGISGANIIFICVGTPALLNGDADLAAVEQVARRIAESVTGYRRFLCDFEGLAGCGKGSRQL